MDTEYLPLIQQEELQKNGHLTLVQRVKHYNQMIDFNNPLTVYSLRKLYRQHSVTFKRIKYRHSWRRDDDVKG